VLETLQARGALFFTDLCEATGRMPVDVAEALWDGVARGWLTSDGFRAVRALLAGRYRSTAARPSRSRSTGRPGLAQPSSFARTPRVGAARLQVPPALAGGRWSLLSAAHPADFAPDELAEAVALQLLARWGVVFRDLAMRESLGIAWRDVLWALRRLEARGVARGGRYVGGVAGEQFGLPEAVDQLRRTASQEPDGLVVRLSAADPLNLTGIVLPGPRIPAVRGGELVLRDGAVARDDAEPRGPVRRLRGTAAS
jgi:ATP-dependent Lhr-like helicase